MQKQITFDPEQQAAIRAFRGAYRVDACAGAGKTSVLIGRITFLLKQGVPESNILALTFTKNAAEEMRTRAHAEKETLRTLHSWALQAAKQEHMEFNPPLRPSVLLFSQFEILLPIAKQCGKQYKEMGSYISNCKRQGFDPQHCYDTAENDEQLLLAEGYANYENACKRAGVLDFDSVIWELVKLFKNKPRVAERHQIPFLMVDEAQDCSAMDWQLIKLISQDHGNIWFVGDFAQSVYGFRGASPDIFAGAGELFPGITTLPMGTNYRSQANIVLYSQKVMPEITSYLDNWRASKPATTQPTFLKFNNDAEEAKWVLAKVTTNQCQMNETAVLARTNAQLALVQGFCAEQGIAYKLLGKENWWKRPEVMGLIGLAQNVRVSNDDGLKAALQSPLPCVKFLKKHEAVHALERAQAGCLNGSTGDPLPLKYMLNRNVLGDFRQDLILRDLHEVLIKAYQMLQGGAQTCAILNFLAQQSGATTMVDGEESGGSDSFVMDNIQKVISMARNYPTIEAFVDFTRKASHPSRKQTKLLLSTVHGFKGKEAKNVFVIGVTADVFPHVRAELQEEKRLYYVAVSRPTENLFVTCAGVPSPFIEELVPKEAVVIPTDPMAGWQLQTQ